MASIFLNAPGGSSGDSGPSGGGLSTIWAEENSPLDVATESGYQWSFGNGAVGVGLELTIGYECSVVALTFNSQTAITATVAIEVNGVQQGTISLTAADSAVLPVTIPLAVGDTVAFRTTAGAAQGTASVVGAVLQSSGATGPQGPAGPDGAAGPGVAAGGTADQVLAKIDGTDFNTQWVDASGGLSETEVQAIAGGSSLGLQQALLAEAGQPGLTVLAVGFTTSGKVQGVSLGAGNVVEVYASGADFNAGTVLYREFMNRGEPICFTGLATGAIITSTQGFYGFCEQVDGTQEGLMPLLSYGLSFTSTFFFAFRDSNEFGQAAIDRGFVRIVNGPLANTIQLTFGDGSVVQGQSGIALQPWEAITLETDGNVEYILSGTQPLMACIHAGMSNADGATADNRFHDSRLIMPLTNDGITWPRSGNVSAPFDNTQVAWYTRDNAEGFLNSGAVPGGVSPGSPVDFDAAPPVGTGASDGDYLPDGATRVRATGLVSAYSGADGAGLEASPLMPTSAMSQVVAQPLFIADTSNGDSSSIAIASPYEGTALVYEYNTGTGALDLVYTVPLNRNGVTVTTQDDQNHPSAGQVSNGPSQTGVVTLVGQLNPGVIIADVPVTVVVQNANASLVPSIRSQNGTTTTSIVNQGDETLSLGITPDQIAAEIREDADGLLRVRRIDNTGAETWDVA